MGNKNPARLVNLNPGQENPGCERLDGRQKMVIFFTAAKSGSSAGATLSAQ